MFRLAYIDVIPICIEKFHMKVVRNYCVTSSKTTECAIGRLVYIFMHVSHGKSNMAT